uniref:Reverse transcriptase Ty1/copia-type domain-containing protein n=1 Tax=Ananas comosus var. bracteatus TaxID=296719 RepID=A0A6V7QMG4_ANACO|nr:unnamed protein product [Ananas comosus var. bracteatus]
MAKLSLQQQLIAAAAAVAQLAAAAECCCCCCSACSSSQVLLLLLLLLSLEQQQVLLLMLLLMLLLYYCCCCCCSGLARSSSKELLLLLSAATAATPAPATGCYYSCCSCTTTTAAAAALLLLAATATTSISNIQEPRTYRQAVSIPEWRDAMTTELTALHRTGTWELVPLPPGKTPISCKWIYKVKTNSDGSIDRYKARLLARGFSQEYGIDYEETFAPVAKMTSIRILIALAASRSWPLYQLDVKNASYMGIFMKKFLCNHLRVFPIHPVMFVGYGRLYMALNKLPELGDKLWLDGVLFPSPVAFLLQHLLHLFELQSLSLRHKEEYENKSQSRQPTE